VACSGVNAMSSSRNTNQSEAAVNGSSRRRATSWLRPMSRYGPLVPDVTAITSNPGRECRPITDWQDRMCSMWGWPALRVAKVTVGMLLVSLMARD